MQNRSRRRIPPVPFEAPVDVDTGEISGIVRCIPLPFRGKDWQRFYLAVRTMLAQKRRGLLDALDQIGIQLHCEMRYGDDEKAKAELLERLCKILENPDAKAVRFFFHRHRELYDRTKGVLTRCREVRRRGAPRAQDEPLNVGRSPMQADAGRPGESPGPGGPMKIDSVEYYRIALQEVYGNWVGQDSPYSCPCEVLEECKSLVTLNKPAEAALVVLAAWTGLKPDYLKKRLYNRPRSRRT